LQLNISQNKAKIINKPQDILDELGLNEEKITSQIFLNQKQ
jgi:hypothetical protein